MENVRQQAYKAYVSYLWPIKQYISVYLKSRTRHSAGPNYFYCQVNCFSHSDFSYRHAGDVAGINSDIC